MNAGGFRSGTRFTPRMADAATQTYLYGSTHPNSLKANHRMGAAGGGLRESHLLRGGAREGSLERVVGVYERTGGDTVKVEFNVRIEPGRLTYEEVRVGDRLWVERHFREMIIRRKAALLHKFLHLWFLQHVRQKLARRRLGERSTGRILRPAVSRMRGRVQTADGGEYSSAESYSDDGYGGHSDDSRTSMELNATYSLRLDPDMDDDDRAQYILRRQGHALRSR